MGDRRTQRRERVLVADRAATRRGFGGHRYASRAVGEMSYADSFEDYQAFLAPALARARELLRPEGTLTCIWTIAKRTT